MGLISRVSSRTYRKNNGGTRHRSKSPRRPRHPRPCNPRSSKMGNPTKPSSKILLRPSQRKPNRPLRLGRHHFIPLHLRLRHPKTIHQKIQQQKLPTTRIRKRSTIERRQTEKTSR